MPRIQTFQPGPVRIAGGGSPERMGAVGRAAATFGQQVARIGTELQQATDTAWHEKTSAELQRRQMEQFKQMQLEHEDIDTFSDAFTKQYDEDVAGLMRTAPSGGARKLFTSSSTRLGTQMFQQAMMHEIAGIRERTNTDLGVAQQTRSNIVRSDPTQLDDMLRNNVSAVQASAAHLTPQESKEHIRNGVTSITYSAGLGRIDVDPMTALESFQDDSMWKEQTTPQQYNALLGAAERAIRADKAAAARKNKEYIGEIKDYIGFKSDGRGLDDPRPPRLSDEAIRRAVPDDAEKLIEEVREAEVMAPQVNAIRSGTPEEAMQIITARAGEAAESSEDFVDRQREIAALQQAWVARQRAVKEDSAAYMAANSPAVREAAEALEFAQATGDQNQIRTEAQELARTQLFEQTRLGVPEQYQRVLTKAQADTHAETIRRKAQQGEIAVDTLRELEDTYGSDLYPQVLMDMGDKLPPAYTVIPGMVDQSAASLLAEAATIEGGTDKILGAVGVKKNDVREEVITQLRDFRETIEGGVNRAFAGNTQYFNKTTDAAVMLAAMYLRDGETSPAAAAEKAAERIVGDRYEFRGTYRIPREHNPDYVVAGANATVRDLDTLAWEIDVDAMRSLYAIETFDPGEMRSQILQAINQDGVTWVTAPDDSGLIMATASTGVPIPATSGGVIKRTWDQLSRLGLDVSVHITQEE